MEQSHAGWLQRSYFSGLATVAFPAAEAVLLLSSGGVSTCTTGVERYSTGSYNIECGSPETESRYWQNTYQALTCQQCCRFSRNITLVTRELFIFIIKTLVFRIKVSRYKTIWFWKKPHCLPNVTAFSTNNSMRIIKVRIVVSSAHEL